MFDSTMFLENQRLPELVCGFDRREGEGPTLYPVACMPQAWAAGAPFLLLASILGLSIDGRQSELRFIKPALPDFINELHIEGLRVGRGSVDLQIVRWGDDAAVSLVRKSGDVSLVVSSKNRRRASWSSPSSDASGLAGVSFPGQRAEPVAQLTRVGAGTNPV